jgi:thiamine biosynthesis lipoprotein ApbE
MDISTVWSAALTIIMALLGFIVRAKDAELKDTKDELARVTILVNRTREEVAKTEVHADINRVLDRLDRLDEKLDRLMESKHAGKE